MPPSGIAAWGSPGLSPSIGSSARRCCVVLTPGRTSAACELPQRACHMRWVPPLGGIMPGFIWLTPAPSPRTAPSDDNATQAWPARWPLGPSRVAGPLLFIALIALLHALEPEVTTAMRSASTRWMTSDGSWIAFFLGATGIGALAFVLHRSLGAFEVRYRWNRRSLDRGCRVAPPRHGQYRPGGSRHDDARSHSRDLASSSGCRGGSQRRSSSRQRFAARSAGTDHRRLTLALGTAALASEVAGSRILRPW